ncbi:MAG: FtsQ-type POTRA domain-containing protein [Verrucomicrobiae bacterium]|nr:FtsQ-type POTRA domain-containing protein [Verrucomicrobiae bacterium]
MKWFRTSQKNQLRRHDLQGLDGKLRTRLRQKRQMRFLSVALFVFFVTAGTLWVVWLGMKLSARRMFLENAAYQLADIQVENPGGVLKPAFVVSFLELQKGQNLLGLDSMQLRQKLEILPMVERVEFSKELPSRLVIRIAERVPVANLSMGTGGIPYQIDRRGMVMNLGAFEKDSAEYQKRIQALPQITGAKVADLRIGRVVSSQEIIQGLAFLQQIDKAGLKTELDVEEINVAKPGMLLVRAADGLLVKVGMGPLRKQLSRLNLLLREAQQNSTRLTTVDLTVGGADVPVTFAATP